MTAIPLVNLPEFARDVVTRLLPLADARGERATIVALSGNLGAGKTTFVQVLARELGVKDIVQSPTYVIMKKYQVSSSKYQETFKTLVHIDLYRLEKPEELAALKLEKVFAEPSALVVIEWPERAEGALPKADMVLKFSSDGASAEERYIEAT